MLVTSYFEALRHKEPYLYKNEGDQRIAAMQGFATVSSLSWLRQVGSCCVDVDGDVDAFNRTRVFWDPWVLPTLRSWNVASNVMSRLFRNNLSSPKFVVPCHFRCSIRMIARQIILLVSVFAR